MKNIFILLAAMMSLNSVAKAADSSAIHFEIIDHKNNASLSGDCSDDSCTSLNITVQSKLDGSFLFGTIAVSEFKQKLMDAANKLRNKPEYFSVNKSMWDSSPADTKFWAEVTIGSLGIMEIGATEEDLLAAPVIAIERGVSQAEYLNAQNKIFEAASTGTSLVVSHSTYGRIVSMFFVAIQAAR